MQMGELSERSGIPIHTIKYYLRTDLLFQGLATAATRAQYDQSHLRRLRLIRALLERGDLTPAIALTGFGSMDKALSAVHDLKAFWYLEKPVEPRTFKT